MFTYLRDWFCYRSRLNEIEMLVVKAVGSCLSSEGCDLLMRQVSAVNMVQRMWASKEVNLYCLRHGKLTWDLSTIFPDQRAEVLLAKVAISRPGIRSKLHAKVFVVTGHLFSLMFDKSPSAFTKGLSSKDLQALVCVPTLLADPMVGRAAPLETGEDVSANLASTALWLEDWGLPGDVSGLRNPLSLDALSASVENIDAALPSDYLALLERTEGAIIGSCEIFGSANIRYVATEEVNYYLIAEITGCPGGLAVREGDNDGEIFFHDYETYEVKQVGSSLKDALARLPKWTDM